MMDEFYVAASVSGCWYCACWLRVALSQFTATFTDNRAIINATPVHFLVLQVSVATMKTDLLCTLTHTSVIILLSIHIDLEYNNGCYKLLTRHT